MQNKNQGEWSSYSIHAQNTNHSETLRRTRKSCLDGNKLSLHNSNGYDLNGKTANNGNLSSVSAKKSRLRNFLLTKRKNQSEKRVEELSLSISFNLFTRENFVKSTNIALYHPVSAEVDTRHIFKRAVDEGKKAYFPRVSGNELLFFRVDSLDGLNPGFNRIPEPSVTGEMSDAGDLDLIIVPGLGFDYSGNRLGYGGGFFDRYLKVIPRSRTVALAYDFQVVDSIPAADHDVQVGWIITESRVINCIENTGGIKC